MRALLSSFVMSIALAAYAVPAHAQQVTKLPESTKNAVGLEAGLDTSFIARGSYTRRLELGVLRDERFVGRLTLPFVAPDLSDWAIDLGAQATVVSAGNLRLAILAGPLVKNTSNHLYDATAFGIGATALFGYEGTRWGLSGELSHEQILGTWLRHSDLYRDTAFPDAKDGLYATTGSSTRAGLRGGFRVGAVELSARAGTGGTGYFRPANPPFFFTLGAAYAF